MGVYNVYNDNDVIMVYENKMDLVAFEMNKNKICSYLWKKLINKN
jgi:hypothetical protein